MKKFIVFFAAFVVCGSGISQALDKEKFTNHFRKAFNLDSKMAISVGDVVPSTFAGLLSFPVAIGGQDCHPLPSGAFTGDISAEMLRDAGATAVILGHSERRLYRGEVDSLIAAKVKAAHRTGLTAILCVGESETQRKQGRAGEVVAAQLEACVPAEITALDLVVAYEPIWAIGTGKTPRAAEIAQMHGAVRALLTARFGADATEIRILYGGSVKPENAAEILAVPNVDGALIGGASLKAADFLAIIRAVPGH
jgi:triosephosphate isomerase